MLEEKSAGPLLRLSRMPRLAKILLGIAVVAILLLGMFLPWSWAGIFLLVIAGLVSWLVALSWPVLPASGRLIRVLVIAVLVLAALWRFTGHS